MRNNRLILTILLFVTILLPGCKKWIFDYRNKWTGDYSFKWTSNKWNGYVWTTTNQNTDGKVYYRPLHNFGKSITIQIFDLETFTADVDKAGNLKKVDDAEFEGHITTSTITFTALSNGKPGTHYTVTATRQ
jgi:hypothetical protein